MMNVLFAYTNSEPSVIGTLGGMEGRMLDPVISEPFPVAYRDENRTELSILYVTFEKTPSENVKVVYLPETNPVVAL